MSDLNMNIEVMLKPINVPETIEAGIPKSTFWVEDTCISTLEIELKSLPEEKLSALCDEFRVNVFGKAGKIDPKSDYERERTLLIKELDLERSLRNFINNSLLDIPPIEQYFIKKDDVMKIIDENMKTHQDGMVEIYGDKTP